MDYGNKGKSAIRLLSLVCICVFPLYAQQPGAQQRVVARAGDVYITEQEFQERFELLPALYRRGKSGLEGSKLELLYSMIAEKLLAQEAADRQLDRDTAFDAAFLELRKLLARDQLYREDVTRAVHVSPEEIRRERSRAERLRHVAFLFVEGRKDADFIRSRISGPADFDRLEPDSSMHAVRDTATVIWGDADPAIEEAAYALSEGDVSPVVESGDGYYILRLINEIPSSIATRYTPDVFRERLASRIRARKEDRKMHEVMDRILPQMRGYARAEPFRRLTDALMTVMRAESTATADSVIIVNAALAERARERCRPFLQDSLIVAGDTRWTVNDVIDRLLSRRFHIERDRIAAVPAVLNGELEYLTGQELLAQEGLRRGLDRRPEVEAKLQIWKQAFLASRMKQFAEQHAEVTAADIWEYRHFLDTSVAAPEVNLRVLRTATLGEMHGAITDLEQQRDFASVVHTWSSDSTARITGGETGFFPITVRQPLGTWAAGLEPGQRFGPVALEGGYLMFELLAKRSPAVKGSAADEDSLRQTVIAMKRQGLLNLFIAQLARNRGYDIYEDRLKAVQVTPIPMLTYRILGFGGRMFEVPFVDPQLQWLNIEPPVEPVLP